MTTPYADLQQLHQTSPFICLYVLDCTALGGGVHRFTDTASLTGGLITFGTAEFLTLPIKTEGWDFTSTGAPPKPTLTIGNAHKTLLAMVINLGDLVGAKLTRYRTYAKYLDDGSSPDSSKYLGPDVYFIEQKTGHNNEFIQFQLSSPIDRLGMMLPRRQILKDKGFPGVSRTRIT